MTNSEPEFPWPRAMLWLTLLGAMFIYGYQYTNALAAEQPQVWRLGGAWDQRVPFIAWTLLPYLSINLIFPCAFFAFESKRALDRFARRLFVAQMVCFACFYFFPTGASRTPPTPEGALGVFYAQLRAFEQPFNMVPSLHVVALVVLWASVRPALPAVARWPWHAWCALVLVSTLTTWQHDLIDVVAGLVVGTACLLIGRPRGA
ncbi:MAG: hypothetical protein EOP81_08095 [Variovorax sp.]|nr:MAG: hypothetical protein EOP81_08095 [Variovorax sp.]